MADETPAATKAVRFRLVGLGMKRISMFCWVLRLSWPLLGGAWGAWLGFGGYLRLPHNADSLAMVFAAGFFGLFAWIGLLAGMAAGALMGALLETLLRRCHIGAVAAVSLATLANAMLLWQIAALVLTSFPGLRPPTVEQRVPATTQPVRQDPCAKQPPEHTQEHAQWALECR